MSSLSIPSKSSDEPWLPAAFRHYADQVYVAENGDTITVVKNSDIPLTATDRKNWAVIDTRKSNRNVRKILELVDGTKPEIFAKNGELQFPSALMNEAIQWEIVYLSILQENGFDVEKPQAVIISPEGESTIIVGAIADGIAAQFQAAFSGKPWPDERELRIAILERVKSTTPLIPGNDAFHNFLSDPDARQYIIDVLRWGMQGVRQPLHELLTDDARRSA